MLPEDVGNDPLHLSLVDGLVQVGDLQLHWIRRRRRKAGGIQG